MPYVASREKRKELVLRELAKASERRLSQKDEKLCKWTGRKVFTVKIPCL